MTRHPDYYQLQFFTNSEFYLADQKKFWKQFSIKAQITHLQSPQECITTLNFNLEGPVEQLILPEMQTALRRKDELWKSTCFEAFLSYDQTPNSPYFEFNFSSEGGWNLYQLDSCRTGLRPLDLQTSPSIHCNKDLQSFELSAKTTWNPPPAKSATNLAFASLNVILESKSGEKSFWALAHCSPQPDFHNKQSFKIAF